MHICMGHAEGNNILYTICDYFYDQQYSVMMIFSNYYKFVILIMCTNMINRHNIGTVAGAS